MAKYRAAVAESLLVAPAIVKTMEFQMPRDGRAINRAKRVLGEQCVVFRVEQDGSQTKVYPKAAGAAGA